MSTLAEFLRPAWDQADEAAALAARRNEPDVTELLLGLPSVVNPSVENTIMRPFRQNSPIIFGFAISILMALAATSLQGQAAQNKSLTVAQQLSASQRIDPAVTAQRAVLTSKLEGWKQTELIASEMLFNPRQRLEGIALLRALDDARTPDNTVGLAAKLSMAYEILGDNRKALDWAKEFLRRAPDEHERSGWLLLLILDAKIQRETNPEWLKSRHVIEAQDKRLLADDFSYNLGDRVLSRREVQNVIFAELKQRMSVVKPKDPVVADLLYTLALLQKGAEAFQSALDLIALAEQYGHPVPARLKTELRLLTGKR